MMRKRGRFDNVAQARLDYSWKWFEFHAKQRTTFYHFFLIITGLLINGYFVAYNNSLYEFSLAIGLFGVINTVGFWLIEKRNRQLVGYAEDTLEYIEANTIFPETSYRNESIGLLISDRKNGKREGSVTKKFGKIKTAIYVTKVSVIILFTICVITSLARIHTTIVGHGVEVEQKETIAGEETQVHLPIL
ncbi:TPA: hypothetical protein ACF35B_004663 [Vibrio parahaemolyticus]